MCLAVRYSYNQRDRLVRFTDSYAQLPVLLKSGQTRLMTWGRRESEYNGFPLGGWAKYWHIEQGLWDRYQPRPVKIKVSAYMDHYIVGCEQWSELDNRSYIQGLLASRFNHQLLYLVCRHFGSHEDSIEPCPRVIISNNHK